jgi:hypothetical protein
MFSNTMNGAQKLCFEDIVLHRSNKVSHHPINRENLYRSPQKSIGKRLMREAGLSLSNCVRVVYCEILLDSVQPDLTYEEWDVRHLCSRLQVHEGKSRRVFRECITNKSLPSALKRLQGCIDFVPVLSKECKSGFSQKNLIATHSYPLTVPVSRFLFVRKVWEIWSNEVRCRNSHKKTKTWLDVWNLV